MQQRVLVADDDPDVRDLVRQVLGDDLDVRVDEARDGYEAILWIRDARPDALVLDVRMPRVDGRGVLHWLKSSPSTAAIPVLLLTALEPAGALQGVERGADRVLRKPFELAELVGAVGALLARGGRGQPVSPGAPTPA